MSRQLRPSPTCLNCGVAVTTRFCPECGQENTTYRVSLGRLVGDLFEEVFQLESRLWRTVWALFRRPGLLTREYNAGRRVSYTTPLRLYLVASVAYFFVAGILPQRSDENVHVSMPELTAEQQHKIDEAPPWARALYGRARAAMKDPNAAVARMRRTVSDWAPRIAALLVPLCAFLTWLCFRRPKLFFVEHLVFALHLHATAFLLLLVAEAARWEPIGFLATIAGIVIVFRAARVVFGQSRVATFFKLGAIACVYGLFLGLGIAGVAALGFLSRG